MRCDSIAQICVKGAVATVRLMSGRGYRVRTLPVDDLANALVVDEITAFPRTRLPEGTRDIILLSRNRMVLVIESSPAIFFVTLTRADRITLHEIRAYTAQASPVTDKTPLRTFDPLGPEGRITPVPKSMREIRELHEISGLLEAHIASISNKASPAGKDRASSPARQEGTISSKIAGAPAGTLEEVISLHTGFQALEPGSRDFTYTLLDRGYGELRSHREPCRSSFIFFDDLLASLGRLKRRRIGPLPSRTIDVSLDGRDVALTIRGCSKPKPLTYRESGSGRKYEFRAVKYPEHIFHVRLTGNDEGGYFLEEAFIFAIKDDSLRDDTPLFGMPFSNIFDEGRVCYGDEFDPILPSLQSLTSTVMNPYYYLDFSNDLSDNFREFRISQGEEITTCRDLYSFLDGAQSFPEQALHPIGTYDAIIGQIIIS